jgi:hypothetical protein
LQNVVDEAGDCDYQQLHPKCYAHFYSHQPCCIEEGRRALAEVNYRQVAPPVREPFDRRFLDALRRVNAPDDVIARVEAILATEGEQG